MTVFFLTASPIVLADSANLEAYGVNVNPFVSAAIPDVQAECDIVVASGVKWVRLSPYWSEIEKWGPGLYDTGMLARLDATVDRLQSRGVNVLMLLAHTPQWASTHPDADWRKYRPTDWSTWENYVTFMTNRYKGKVKHWEVWNEPDLGGYWLDTVPNFAELMKRAYTKIKATDATNTVLMAGLAAYDGVGDYFGPGTFLDQLLSEPGVTTSFDVMNYHAYGNLKRHIAVYQGMMQVMTSHGVQGKPIWISESGFSTQGYTAREVNKADVTDQIWVADTGLNIQKVFYYVYRNPVVYTPDPSEENFGFCTLSFTPLKSFYHYQALNGAEANPLLQTLIPTSQPYLSLRQAMPASGDGSQVASYHRITAGTYAYYRVDDTWARNTNETFYADVIYKDTSTSSFSLEYESTTNAYQSLSQARANSGNWLTKTFTLSNAKLANGQNNGADFRLFAGPGDLLIKSIVLRRASNSSSYAMWPVSLQTGDGSQVYAESSIPAGTSMYFQAHDYWIYGDNDGLDSTLYADVTYRDAGTGSFSVQYQSATNLYETLPQYRTNSGSWLTRTFILSQANLRNGQLNASDLRLNAGGSNLDVRSVVLHRSLDTASVRVKAAPTWKLMNMLLPTGSADESYTTAETMGGMDCRKAAAGKYFHFDASEGFVRSGDMNVTISYTYWDGGSGNITLQYNAVGNTSKSGPSVTRTGTSTWKTVTIPISDADFTTSLSSNRADFRIGGGDVYLSKVDVTRDNAGPDLQIVSLSCSPANPQPGNAVTFSAVVKNRGTAATPTGKVVSATFFVDGTGISWGAPNISIPAGGTTTVTATSGTWTATSGWHSYKAIVDDQNRIAETDETNNWYALDTGINVGSDLEVTGLSWTPTNPQPGNAVTFSAVVKNRGTVATPAGQVVSATFFVDGTGISWGAPTISIPAGGSTTITATSGTWTAASGAHTFQTCDSPGNVDFLGKFWVIFRDGAHVESQVSNCQTSQGRSRPERGGGMEGAIGEKVHGECIDPKAL